MQPRRRIDAIIEEFEVYEKFKTNPRCTPMANNQLYFQSNALQDTS